MDMNWSFSANSVATLRGSYGEGKGLVRLNCLGRSKFAFRLRETLAGRSPLRISYWEADVQVWLEHVGTLFSCDFVLGG